MSVGSCVCKNQMCHLRVGCFIYTCTQRFAAWRSGGFLAQKFNRRTALEPITKLSYKALHPPLRQTAVSSRFSHSLSVSSLMICSFSRFLISGASCCKYSSPKNKFPCFLFCLGSILSINIASKMSPKF